MQARCWHRCRPSRSAGFHPYGSARARTSRRAASAMLSRSMPGGRQQLGRRPRARHADDREPLDRRMLVQPGERREHGLAQAALGPVILDGQDRAGRGGSLAQAFHVDRLHGVAVDHAGRDSLGLEGVGGRQCLDHRDPGAHDRDVVVIGGAQHAAAADRELLVGPVDDRGRGPGRPQVGDALEPGHRRDELRGLVPVARVEDGAAADGAHHGEILERHLRRPVLTDGDARVGSGERDRRPADRGHANEVVGAGQERGEGRGERLPAAHLQADRGGDHLLLGDVHLEEPLRVGGAKDLGVRGVRDLAVERDDPPVGGADRGQRIAVGLARGHLVAELVAGQLERDGGEGVRLGALANADVDSQVALAAELGHGRLGIVRAASRASRRGSRPRSRLSLSASARR